MEPEGITVSQACQQLGVSERTLRRLLRAPETQAKLVAINRRVGGRNRQIVLLPPALVTAFQADLSEKKASAPVPSPSTGNQQAAAGTMPMLAYERLLAEKDARLSELAVALAQEKAQNARLLELLSAARPASSKVQMSLWRRLLRRDG